MNARGPGCSARAETRAAQGTKIPLLPVVPANISSYYASYSKAPEPLPFLIWLLSLRFLGGIFMHTLPESATHGLGQKNGGFAVLVAQAIRSRKRSEERRVGQESRSRW